jgi:hypothetical protein
MAQQFEQHAGGFQQHVDRALDTLRDSRHSYLPLDIGKGRRLLSYSQYQDVTVPPHEGAAR